MRFVRPAHIMWDRLSGRSDAGCHGEARLGCNGGAGTRMRVRAPNCRRIIKPMSASVLAALIGGMPQACVVTGPVKVDYQGSRNWSGSAGGEASQAISPVSVSPSVEPASQAKPFAPGVRIDWQERTVELDVEIVLRRGPLELLACSPRTREHESILRVRAQPMHIFQAMGLIGLEPGLPLHYDENHDRWIAPTGESLELEVCCREGEQNSFAPVERWLLDVRRGRPPERLDWVFAGSRTFDNGRFGADVDGTVICVVDFDTALIGLGSFHTADNERLWLAANTEAIPPAGSSCTLLIHSAARKSSTVPSRPHPEKRAIQSQPPRRKDDHGP